jgi:hypothetical protein
MTPEVKTGEQYRMTIRAGIGGAYSEESPYSDVVVVP